MKKRIILFVVCLLAAEMVTAQSLIDQDLQRFGRQTLIDGINKYGNDVNEAGVVIMDVNTGNVIANVCIQKDKGTVKDNPNGNTEAIPSGISRAVLYLAMMGTLYPNYVVDTGKGIYSDSIMGCTITDMTYSRGGFGSLTLNKALDLSDVGIIKAVEAAFSKNMARYGQAVRKTGIFFSDLSTIEDDSEPDRYQPWSPCDIMGRSPYSLLQQTSWVNMIANGGDLVIRLNGNDFITPICKVNNKAGLENLSSAMFEAVEYGTGAKMRSKFCRVAGLVNVSEADVLNYRSCFAAAFFPYEAPQYTIGLYVNKYGMPAGRVIASKIAGQIIEYMVKEYLHLQEKRTILPFRVYSEEKGQYHPAEK